MKLKHNKKRNTAFLYEAIIKEVAKTIVSGDRERKEKLIRFLKENFSKGKVLKKELDLYKALGETSGVDLYTAERLIQETRKEYSNLDKKTIFEAQTSLIDSINKNYGKEVFSNFVPNYRNLATIAQIFGGGLPPKERVLLERNIVSCLVATQKKDLEDKNLPHIDDLVYRKVVENFNSRYGGGLLEEQKALLSRYITSLGDNQIEFKVYLNEELSRIRQSVEDLYTNEVIKKDDSMKHKVSLVLEKIKSFSQRPIDAEMIQQVLKIQSLAQECTE